MKLEAVPCPCGRCVKWLVKPLFSSQDATLYKEQADELVRRWNAFEVGEVEQAVLEHAGSKLTPTQRFAVETARTVGRGSLVKGKHGGMWFTPDGSLEVCSTGTVLALIRKKQVRVTRARGGDPLEVTV